nr:hypothetical protein [Planctomycetaceae bacterium]
PNLDAGQLLRNWRDHSGQAAPDQDWTPAFSGFVDCLILRRDFLQRMVPTLGLLREVWHELAIPTAVLQHTSRVGISNGLALWGTDREQPLDRLLRRLGQHDFVHPIKLLRYESQTLLDGYRTA